MTTSREERRAGFRREALAHADALYGLGSRLTGGDAARAEELVRDTLIEARRALGETEPGISLRGWLTALLRDRFLRAHRGRARRTVPPGEDGDAARVSAGLEDAEAGREVLDRLPDRRFVTAIEELGDELRVPLVLADLEGLTYQELGEVLGLPVDGVKSRLFRARRRVRERLLGGAGGGGAGGRADRSGGEAPSAARPGAGDDGPAGGLTCREALDHRYEYLDGELDHETQERIHHHVEICQQCYSRFDIERLVLDTLRDRGLAVEDVDHVRARLASLLEEVG